jgi:23S rRNA (adenine2030-N6)-methyltransferase
MNYRHAFHAGGPADVVKHAVLARILVHLCNKPAAFRVIDTHAGAGLYDLRGPEATRSPEWRDGIARLLAAPIDGEAGTLLAPCELEPNAAAALAHNLGGDRGAKAVAIDGWTALNAYVPPPERRGVVLIDPPFEATDEFSRLAQALEAAHRKWATGIFVLWYPLKGRQDSDMLARRLRRAAIPKVLRAEVDFAMQRKPEGLAGSGLIVVNPPWMLADELEILLPFFAKLFAGQCRVDWIARGSE